MNKSRRFLMCFFWTLLSLTALRLPARADCAGGFMAGFGRQPGPRPNLQTFGIRFGGGSCLLAFDLDLERVQRKFGFTSALGVMLPLSPAIPLSKRRFFDFYAYPGVGYHLGGGGLHGFAFITAGTFINLSADTGMLLEYRRRIRFNASHPDAGWQFEIGYVLIVQD